MKREGNQHVVNTVSNERILNAGCANKCKVPSRVIDEDCTEGSVKLDES